jgi:hypothetical protein
MKKIDFDPDSDFDFEERKHSRLRNRFIDLPSYIGEAICRVKQFDPPSGPRFGIDSGVYEQ